jgi:hypothetical protein
MLKGLVVSTLNKLPQVKPDLVRIYDDWEDWNMKQLLSALQRWLKRNKTEDVPTKEHENPRKRERNWYTQKEGGFIPMVKARARSIFIVKDSTGRTNAHRMTL